MLCRTAPCSLCIQVLHSVKFVLSSALNYMADGSGAVPIDGSLDICSSCCCHGGSGWTAEVSRKSYSSLQPLLLISILDRMSLWILDAASLRRAAELSLCYTLGITWAFIIMCLYCMGWILNSSFSSQCRACCKSTAIVQRLVHPPGCALFPRYCGILCTSSDIRGYCQMEPSIDKPVNLAFKLGTETVGEIFFDTS